MNGVHDLGGMHGFGPVEPEPDEPVFHAGWERRAFALTLAMGAWRRWNLDMSRFAREQMPAHEYLATSYYEHWLWGLERLLVEHGFLAPGELERHGARGGASGRAPGGRPARGRRAASCSGNRRAARLDDPVPPKFERGRSRRRPERPPDGPHPAAPLRPRPAGGDRPRPRRVHLRRHPCRRARAEAPARLQRALRRPRPVGADARRRAMPSTWTSGMTTSIPPELRSLPRDEGARSSARRGRPRPSRWR